MATSRAFGAVKRQVPDIKAAAERLLGRPCLVTGDQGGDCAAAAVGVMARCCDREHLALTPVCAEHGAAAEEKIRAGYDAVCATCRRICASGFFVPGTANEEPSCPECGGEGDVEGRCGSCNVNFVTCWGSDSDDVHEPVSWTVDGTTGPGELCPSCVPPPGSSPTPS